MWARVVGRAVSAERRRDDDKERDDLVSAVPQHGGDAGGLVLQAAPSLAFGIEMDGQEHADERERRWDQRHQHYVEIRNANELGHLERGGAHNRRRDMTAGRGNGLDGTRESRPLDQPLNQVII